MTGGQIITREAAIAAGLSHYFTGKPCKHGHIAERFVSVRICVDCNRLSSRAYHRQNVEAVNARRRDALTPAARARSNARAAEWRRANPERSRALQAARYARNSEAVKAAVAAWQKANPKKVRVSKRRWDRKHQDERLATTRNRRARLRSAVGTHSADDVRAIVKAQRGRCAYCRTLLACTTQHVDHITPVSRGGANGRRNLQALCADCNVRKAARDPIDYARTTGRLL